MDSIEEVDDDYPYYKQWVNSKGQWHNEQGPARVWFKYKLTNKRVKDNPIVIAEYALNGKIIDKEVWELEIAKLKLKRITEL